MVKAGPWTLESKLTMSATLVLRMYLQQTSTEDFAKDGKSVFSTHTQKLLRFFW